MKLQGDNYSSNPFASSNRITKMEVSRAREKRGRLKSLKPKEPPSEDQVKYLEYLCLICKKYGMPYERSRMIGMRSKNEATSIIKQLQMVFQQRGISYRDSDNPEISDQIYTTNKEEEQDG